LTRSSRRDFLRTGLGMTAVLVRGKAAGTVASPAVVPRLAGNAPLVLDATAPLDGNPANVIRMGTARRPDGRELLIDGQSLRLDGQPWLPVMGEFHYARYPADEWREELLKMKAGGIDIAATYVFWIHHEEIEGTFDWSGERSLRGFVERCGEVGLWVVVRCGPWCHGEVRNGGLPDWILKKDLRARTDDKGYLSYARRLYVEIARQLDGLLFKDGGPVIGIQCENEYRGPAEHLLTLKAIARETGLDVPLYTRTGWPALATKMPPGELLPLFGAYADGFWDRELTRMPREYREAFIFTLERDAALAVERPGIDADDHPYFCCEIGGGMMSSYHRRIRIAPTDVESVALVKLGCGSNLQGFYMYHGGTNPDGRLSTLQETQATNYWNDLPVKSYDYQAPLGEFGQINTHYHPLRRVNLFLRDHGRTVAQLAPRLPVVQPNSPADTATLRWAARTDGRSGLLFVNNYQRLQKMPARNGIQFELRLPSGPLRMPSEPFTVPENCIFFWPFHHRLGGTRLIYASAQPVCSIEDDGRTYAVFAETPGVAAEFVFEGTNDLALERTTGRAVSDDSGLHIRDVKPGTESAIQLRTSSGSRVCVILLDHEGSLTCWKDELLGRQRLFLTRAGLVVDGNQLRLTAENPEHLAVSILPAPESVAADGEKLGATQDGLFRRYVAHASRPSAVTACAELVREAGPPRAIRVGSQGVAEAPSDSDFDQAAVWRLRLPLNVDASRDLLLRIRYVGDVARVYLDGRLLIDDFYDGSSFDVGLKRHAPRIYAGELLIKILPLQKGAPIYFSADVWPDFGRAQGVTRLEGVEVIERRYVTLNLT
jgi:beta-galactosidase